MSTARITYAYAELPARASQAQEDAEDQRAYDEAMAEAGPNIPWAQVEAELGLS